MPYKKLSELPKIVQNLPKLAQAMWMRVFNRAIKTYSDANAFRIAWDVVNQFYVKKNNKWTKRK